MLSIIIPTKNEEHYLPKLLNSIKKQTYKDYEIIISDAGSDDRTREIARKFGCKIIKGGLPSVGRNNGAKHARGDLLLFLDADVILPKGFLKNLVKKIEERNLDVGSCFFEPYDGNMFDKYTVKISNFLMNVVKNVWPHAYGWCIFSKKWVHKTIGGFNKNIRLGEDHDYAKRASKVGKFGIIKDLKALNSMRRYAKEGRIRTSIKYVIMEFHRLFIGEVKGNKIKYNFDYEK